MSDDIVDRLRAEGSELSIEAADEMDQLHCRIVALEAELTAVHGAITWPSQEQRAEFHIHYEHGGPPDVPNDDDASRR